MSGSRSQGFGSYLLSIGDFFSKPVFLNVKKQQNMATSIGGILTLVLILILLTQGSIEFFKMTNREQPQILQLDEFVSDPPDVFLSKFDNNFNFALMITVGGTPINMSSASLLTLSATSNLYRRDNSTTDRTRYKSQVSFAPCNNSDFPDEVFGNGTFSSYQLDSAYCPTSVNYLKDGKCPDFLPQDIQDNNCTSPPIFNISGTYLSQYFSFIQFNFQICDKTNPNLALQYQMQCAELSDIYQIFNNDTEVKVNIYFGNSLANPMIYSPPNQTYLDVLYWDVNPSLYKVADIFIDQQIVQDYSDYISSSKNYNTSFYSIDTSKVREGENYLYRNDTKQTLLQFNFRRNTFNLVTTRIYVKIPDIMAQIGGFSKSIIFIFAFVALGYARYKYRMVLSNELYDFEPADKNNKKERKFTRGTKKFGQETIVRQQLDKDFVEELEKNNNLGEGLLEKDSATGKASNGPKEPNESQEEHEEVKDFFEYQKLKKKRLDYSEIHYLKRIFCCKRKTPEERLASKARNQVEEDVDLIKILKKLKEIDKLKLLLLDRNQRELFNYIPKPLITIKEEKPVHHDLDISQLANETGDEANSPTKSNPHEFEALSKYGKLYVAYRGAKDNSDPVKEAYNKKLLAMLGPELIKIFEHVDKEVGDEVDLKHFEETIKRIIEEGDHHEVLSF